MRLGGQEKSKLPVWNEGGKCPDFLNAVSFSKNGMKEWHYINLNQEKWHCLAAQLKEEEFESA